MFFHAFISLYKSFILNFVTLNVFIFYYYRYNSILYLCIDICTGTYRDIMKYAPTSIYMRQLWGPLLGSELSQNWCQPQRLCHQDSQLLLCRGFLPCTGLQSYLNVNCHDWCFVGSLVVYYRPTPATDLASYCDVQFYRWLVMC